MMMNLFVAASVVVEQEVEESEDEDLPPLPAPDPLFGEKMAARLESIELISKTQVFSLEATGRAPVLETYPFSARPRDILWYYGATQSPRIWPEHDRLRLCHPSGIGFVEGTELDAPIKNAPFHARPQEAPIVLRIVILPK
jgi:hypothetical protein